MSRVCVLDLELIHDPETNGGWGAARRGECGVSIVVVYDSATSRPYIYWEHELVRAMEHINSADLLITFNGKNFDIPILEALTGVDLKVKHLDLLAEVHSASGTRKGYGLGDLAERCLGRPKVADGKKALEFYAHQEWDKLAGYCISDVILTLRLYNFILLEGGVLAPDRSLVNINLGGDMTVLI